MPEGRGQRTEMRGQARNGRRKTGDGKRETENGFFTFYRLPSTLLPFFLLLAFFPSPLYSRDVYLQLMAHGKRLNIGISEFIPRRAAINESKFSREAISVVRNDLLFTKIFNIVTGGPPYTGEKDELNYWRQLNADILLTGTILLEGKNAYVLARLIDVGSSYEIWSGEFSDDVKNLRKISHSISDEVILRLTGEDGIASTKIAFVNDSSGAKEIYTIDYDGYNLQKITNENSIIILPKFSSDAKEIIYTTYRYGNPDLYSIEFKTMKKRKVSSVQGLNTTATFSPDSSMIALTMSRGQAPNLYLISRHGDFLRQLTFHKGIDTSPSFSPSGNEIVFISNRPGYPQLYIMNADGTNVRRISTRDFCDSPSWSPKGDKIAFAMRNAGCYNIYVYNIRAEKTVQLTFNSGNNENPSWSPDGRFIVFTSTRNGKKELFKMFLDGSGQSRVAEIPGRCFTPNWSPRLY